MYDGFLTAIEALSGKEVRIESGNEATTLLIDQWHVELETMIHVAAQMPAWRFIELLKLIDELKTKYYVGLSELP